MKCKSCNEDVPPKFTHALVANVCPYCGEKIIDEKLQEILGELKISLGDAKDYMDAVEDWLFHNFSLKKIKPEEVVVNKEEYQKMVEKNQSPVFVKGQGNSFHRADDGNTESQAEGPAQPVTAFAKRAGITKVKRAVDFIKGHTIGAADPSEFVGVDPEYGDVSAMPEDDKNVAPLPKDSSLEGIFDSGSLNNESRELELQKLKRLNAGGGLFNRRD